MRATEQLGRYRLLDLVTQDPGLGSGHEDVYLWHGYDEVLDRPVAMRVLSADDPRAPAVLGAAQAAAAVDDRRLLRVLDILDLPATASDVARVAVVSEWASGRNLERTIAGPARAPRSPPPRPSRWSPRWPAPSPRARAENVAHGRLRPSSVFITDAGEVRVRGLAVDAALFGPLPDLPDRAAGRRRRARARSSTCSPPATGPVTPRSRPRPPRATARSCCRPSQVRAAVPRGVDDVVARSVVDRRARARGGPGAGRRQPSPPWSGAALDHVAPVSTTTIRAAASPGRRRARTALIAVRPPASRWSWQPRSCSASPGAAGSCSPAGPTRPPTSRPPTIDEILTAPARPVDDLSGSTIEQTFPIVKYRSYDPFGDDDGNGKPDKRKGRESEELADHGQRRRPGHGLADRRSTRRPISTARRASASSSTSVSPRTSSRCR